MGGLGGRHAEPVLPRYRDWVEQLFKAGHAVVLPDSYGSRELGPRCRDKERRVLARRERVADIVATRRWLAEQAWVAQDRVSLIGWANGASALLWAVRPQAARHTGPDFRSAVAFYPDCRISAGLGWSARVPTLLLIGARDDVSSPSACRQMVEGARGRSALARIEIYLRRATRFRPRQSSVARARRRRRSARARPHRHRCRSPLGLGKARDGVAGAVDQLLPQLATGQLGESMSKGSEGRGAG